jgi:hypothetical protein
MLLGLRGERPGLVRVAAKYPRDGVDLLDALDDPFVA